MYILILKSFALWKILLRECNKKTHTWIKYYENHISEKELISKIYKACSKFSSNKIINWSKNSNTLPNNIHGQQRNIKKYAYRVIRKIHIKIK